MLQLTLTLTTEISVLVAGGVINSSSSVSYLMKNCNVRYERLFNECNGSNDLINERDNNFIF